MARKKNAPESVRVKSQLAERLRTIRVELYGDRGGPELARQLEIPNRTWYNYEIGVTVPAEILLRFLEVTSVEPHWLLHGDGPRFRTASAQAEPAAVPDPAPTSSSPIEALLAQILQRLDRGQLRLTWEVSSENNHPG